MHEDNGKNMRISHLAVMVGLAVSSTFNTANAKDTDDACTNGICPSLTLDPKLEEVIVTAQKRAESLQEVPLSVSAVNAEKLATAGIETVEDLTILVPNIHFTETGFSTQVRVRGIGSDNSQGFEQSVGMYIDGIYHGRAQLFRTPMMDMERVEVLRGPQSILFGKNSIAGALNLSTARPTEELEGSLTVSREFEHTQDEINAVISGPILEELRGRIAIRSYEEDGYFYNTHKNVDEPIADEMAYRVSLEWTPTEALSFYLKTENNKFETIGRPIEITFDEALNEGGATYAQTLTALSQATFEANGDFNRQFDGEEFSNNEIDNTTFIANYEFNDYNLTFTTGLLDFVYDELCDCDDAPIKAVPLALGEDYDQFSQEIRITSPADQTVEWIAGVFYQEWDQIYADSLPVESDNFLAQRTAALADTGLRRNFEQSSDAWAVFASATWNINERWRTTLGFRYAEEEKEATKIVEIFQPSTGQTLADPFTGFVYLNAFRTETEQATTAFTAGGPVPLLWSGHNVSHKRDEDAFTPLLNVEFNITDDMLSYASITKGFKAGGFDPRSNSVGNFSGAEGLPTTATTEADPFLFFEFEEERATAMELGLKSSIGDGRGEINVALYRTDYDDLQISQFDGAVGFNVGNAKETVVQGIELDGRWALTSWLTANYGLSWLDFEYKDFKNGNCYAGQTRDGIDLDGNDSIDTCDYTGKRGVYTPDYTINVGLDFRHGIGFNDIDLVGFIDVQHVDSQNVHVNLDPEGEIDAYTMLNARLGLDAKHWSVALLGRNLLDEYILSYSANAPLSETSFRTNTHYSIARRPMTIALEGTVRF